MPLPSSLATLEKSGLIRLVQSIPDLEYLFRHALIQEAAYSSLVKTDRRLLHLAVGRALERLGPDHAETLSPQLAQHFVEAGDEDRALKYFSLAGDLAFRKYANAEAVMHYGRALEIARHSSASPSQLIQLYIQRGRALEITGGFDDALANYRDLEALGDQRRDPGFRLAALTARATIHSTPTAVHDPALGQSAGEQGLALARELGDRHAEAKNLWNLLLTHFFAGRIAQAVQFGEQALALARELGDREQLAYTLHDLARAYQGLGQLEKAWEGLQESGALWRQLGNLPMLADSLTTAAESHWLAGEFELAMQEAQESKRINQSIGSSWGESYASGSLGAVLWDRGEMQEAIAEFESAIRLAALGGFAVGYIWGRVQLALVFSELGAIGRGYALLDEAARLGSPSIHDAVVWVQAARAALQVKEGKFEEAEATLQLVNANPPGETFAGFVAFLAAPAQGWLAMARQDFAGAAALADEFTTNFLNYGARFALPETALVKGRALVNLGSFEEARRVLEQARRDSETRSARRLLWQILALEGELESRAGRPDAAKARREEARAFINFIAAHSPPDLRESFLARPDVRKVTGDG